MDLYVKVFLAPGLERHIVCSRSVPDEIIERLDSVHFQMAACASTQTWSELLYILGTMIRIGELS